MVRLGLLDASDDDEEFTTARSPYAAPTEADDSEDEQPHAAADRTPRRSFSPGGLFSRSDGSGRAEASPGARDRLGLAAQLDLDADAVGRWRRALAPPRPLAVEPARDRLVVTPPLPPSSPIQQPRQAPGPRPASQSKTLQLLAAARRARGLPERPFSQLGDAGMWLARSFRPAFGCDGRLARPVVGRGAFFVEIKRVRTTDADPEPALNAALAHLLPEAEAALQELPLRALPACPAYDDDLYAASAARAAVAKAVHAYGKAHAGRLREAFELVGALWLHDATATHVERPTVASAWARELRRAARDDAVGSWLAARARAEVRNTGDGVRAAFLHLARHDVAAAAKACAAAGRTRAALCLAARDEPDSDPAMQVEFARARAVAAAAGGADAALEARVLGVAAGAFDLEDDVELSNPNSAAGLRWRTRLGLHAWYGRGDNFEDALGAFDEAVCDGRARAPLADEVGGRVPAAHYTLLKLAFSSDFEDADALLTSFAHGLRCGEAPGGRWHLALCLRALGVEVAQASLTRLGAAFVEDLCGRGLWHWALLVIAATHDDPEIRERLARDVLERHAWPPDAAGTPGAQLRPGAVEARKRLEEAYELRRAFCGAALQAPDEWLESALATRAGAACGGGAAHVSHLVGARRWAEAERALRRRCPEALVAGRPAALRPVLEACEAAFVADGKGAAWRAGAGLYLDYVRFREDLAAAMVALDEGAPPDAHMLAGLASSARALRSRVDGSAALAADGAVCATAGDAPDDLVLLACRSSLTSELDDAARKLDDASGLRAAAADPVDDVPVQTPHANCKQDVCIELADALIAGE